MPRRRSIDYTPTPDPDDRVSTTMALLLPLHRAATIDWLADAAATAAERIAHATYAFLYFEDHDGRLDRKAPASDLRRRAQQRAIDAFGPALRGKLDPATAPAISEALDAGRTLTAAAADALAGIVDADHARHARTALDIGSVSVVPLINAGERLGAMLLLHAAEPNAEHLRLLAEHVACAAVNLRQGAAISDDSVADVMRTVFDARKLERELQRELGRADRYQRTVSIVIIEATNVRLLRERFGRFLAARLIQRLGEWLAQNSRDIDLIGAWKDTGYTMVLAEASSGAAETAAQRLLAVARRTTVDGDPVPGLELHLSSGWATAPADGATTEALFDAAQRRMYDAASQVA